MLCLENLFSSDQQVEPLLTSCSFGIQLTVPSSFSRLRIRNALSIYVIIEVYVKTKPQQVTPTLNFNPRVYGDPSASGCRNLIPPEYSGVCSQNLCILEFAFYIVLFLCCLIES